MKALVVCCDRIPTRLLGCYGSEWTETPTIDRLAAEGVVYDEVYATSLRQGGSADEFVDRLSRRPLGLQIRLLSDRASPAESTAQSSTFWESPPASIVRGIANVPLDRVLSDPYRRVPSINHPEFRKWIDRWRRQIACDDAKDPPPDSCESLFAMAAAAWDEHADADHFLLWLNVSLADADWAPPKNWRDRRLGDADAPASLIDPIPGLVGQLYSKDDVERVAEGWVDRLAYFDALLGALVQSIEESSEEPPILVFFAEQGEPLGEHGVVGPHPDGPRSARRKELTTSSDVAEMIATWFSEIGPTIAERSTEERWAIRCRLQSATLLLTHWWKLIEDVDRVGLYSRRDDFLDMNDLSIRSPAIVDDLQAVLRNLDD